MIWIVILSILSIHTEINAEESLLWWTPNVHISLIAPPDLPESKKENRCTAVLVSGNIFYF